MYIFDFRQQPDTKSIDRASVAVTTILINLGNLADNLRCIWIGLRDWYQARSIPEGWPSRALVSPSEDGERGICYERHNADKRQDRVNQV